MKIITLPKLIDLKLASYQREPLHRVQSLADVIEIIKRKNLNEEYSKYLHPSIRPFYEKLIIGLEEDAKKGSLDDE